MNGTEIKLLKVSKLHYDLAIGSFLFSEVFKIQESNLSQKRFDSPVKNSSKYDLRPKPTSYSKQEGSEAKVSRSEKTKASEKSKFASKNKEDKENDLSLVEKECKSIFVDSGDLELVLELKGLFFSNNTAKKEISEASLDQVKWKSCTQNKD